MTNKTVQENTQTKNTTQKRQTMQKYSKSKQPWFSRVLWHSARKRDGLVLQRSRAHMEQVIISCLQI